MSRLLLVVAAPLMAALLILSPATGVAAAEALDEAVVPVANQGDAARAAAASMALRQVLVKLSGDRRGVDAHPELLKDAASRVQQYQYRDSEGGPQVWMKFDAGSVRQLLTTAGLPLWSAERPTLLLWQVTEQGGGATIVAATPASSVAAAVLTTASQRGVPLLLPTLDSNAPPISVDEIRQADTARLRSASSPYAAGEVAAAVVSLGQDGRWRGRFTLLRGEHGQTWVAQGDSAEAVSAQGVDQIVDALAAPVAAASTGTTAAAEVHVVGLTTLQQMAQVESYLRTLPGMNRVELARLAPNQVTFRMLASGGPQGAAAAIGSGQVLLPGGAEMTYRLNPAAPPPVSGSEGTAAVPAAANTPGVAAPAASAPAPATPPADAVDATPSM